MSSSSSFQSGLVGGCRALFLVLTVVASLLTCATSVTDCQASSPSPSPAPSPSSNSSNPNSRFRSNVVALLDALPSAAAPTGFASLSRGNGTDRAFVRGICRGDSTPGDCATYLQSAVGNITSACNDTTRRAGMWFDKCFVSYADTNATNDYERRYRAILYNTGKVGNADAFETSYYALMRGLQVRVVNGSGGNNPALPSAPMFATGEATYDAAAPNGTMYGLLQCMRDRTAAECDQCLQDSIRQLPSCCYGNQGGVALGYNCNLRVEIYTYYDLALDAPPPVAPAPSTIDGGQRRGKKGADATALAVALPVGTVLTVVVVVGFGVFLHRRKKANRNEAAPPADNSTKEEHDQYIEPEKLNLAVLRTATNNFSQENKLGQGGFGEVFKGILEDGEEIAVKRLSQGSSQGFHELKNELVLAAKLKHKNLMQLLGVCLEEEKLLVYEYMPNRSLDTFLFDPVRRQQLDWSKRLSIIHGIYSTGTSLSPRGVPLEGLLREISLET